MNQDCFSSSYSEARNKFLESANAAGANIHSYSRSDVCGLEGEPLCVDVAVIGREDATNAAIVITGTHGVEGFCGSAIVIQWLRNHVNSVFSRDLKVVIVHAINPWAFSNMLRTTENNVDLNRNFISGPYEGNNPAHDPLFSLITSGEFTASGSLTAFEQYNRFLEGQECGFENQLFEGQFHRPDGLYYAGSEAEWSNSTFRQIVRDHLSSAEKVGFIDWHTGIGKYGEVVLLVFDEVDNEAHDQAHLWWNRASNGRHSFSSGSIPEYRGLLCQSIGQELTTTKIAGAVVEFGTVDDFTLFRSDRIAVWLAKTDSNDPEYEAMRSDYRDVFYPRDNLWRRSVITEGPIYMDQLVHGILKWGK